MYHQSKNGSTSCVISGPREEPLLMQSAQFHGDTGLVLSTDAKPRLKWSAELHARFVEAVTQLGGSEKATPKAIKRVMGISGLTLYHLKSHLQKYRLSKHQPTQTNNVNIIKRNGGFAGYADRLSEVAMPYTNNMDSSDLNSNMYERGNLPIGEALQMQIEVQQKLHEQLEVQRHLQLRIEAQGKYLQYVLKKAQETLAHQNLGTGGGGEAARGGISEMVSEVSNECLLSPSSGSIDVTGLRVKHQIHKAQLGDCSADSCLTSLETPQKDESQIAVKNLRAPHGNSPSNRRETGEDPSFRHGDICRPECMNTTLTSSMERSSDYRSFAAQRNMSHLSMSLAIHKEESEGTYTESRQNQKPTEAIFSEQTPCKSTSLQEEAEEQTRDFSMMYMDSKLDLNASLDNSATSTYRRFDLNGLTCN